MQLRYRAGPGEYHTPCPQDLLTAVPTDPLAEPDPRLNLSPQSRPIRPNYLHAVLHRPRAEPPRDPNQKGKNCCGIEFPGQFLPAACRTPLNKKPCNHLSPPCLLPPTHDCEYLG